MNLGYPCINLSLKNEGITTNRGMIKRTFKEKGIEYASELAQRKWSREYYHRNKERINKKKLWKGIMNHERIHNEIIERAVERNNIDGYTEIHHILPRCMGGDDNDSNLVELTAREHFLVHWLLHEIYPSNFKLKFAFTMMCNIRNRNQDRYIPSSRLYEYSKECMVELNKEIGKRKIGKVYPKLSESKRGYKHSKKARQNMSEAQKNMSSESRLNITKSQQNKMWITDGNDDKRVDVNSEIPDGFRKGRSYSPSKKTKELQRTKMKNKMNGYKNPASKEVYQYTLDGDFIKKYDTIREAESEIGISKIGMMCNGHRSSDKFIFRFNKL